MKLIPVDIYHQKVYAFDSVKDIERYCKKNQYDYDSISDMVMSSHGVSGILDPIDETADVQPIFFIFVKDPSLDTIIHECTHIAMFMLAVIGVTVDVCEQEPIAYLIPYLTKSYCQQFKLYPDVDWS